MMAYYQQQYMQQMAAAGYMGYGGQQPGAAQ